MVDVVGSFLPRSDWTTGLLTLAALAIARAILFRRRGHHPSPPGALPLLGHALSLSDSDEFLRVLTKWGEDVGGKDGAYEFSLLGQRWIVLCRTDAVMEAMRLRPYKMQRASGMTDVINGLGLKGLFNAEGDDWKRDRRVVGPALNKNHVEDYFHFIKVVCDRLVNKWDGERECVKALTDTNRFSLDVVALSILGIDFDSLNHPDHQLVGDIDELFRVTFQRTLSPLPYWKIPFCSNLDGGRAVSKRILDMFHSLVRDCRKRKEEMNRTGKPNQEKHETFLQKLIDISDGEGAKLNEERMVGNLATLINAGKDTTSTTIGICLWEIANDAELQDELHSEIMESGVNTKDLTLSHLTNGYPRLHSLLFEVLRAKGPGPFFLLKPGEAVDFLGETIGPGTMICALTQSLGDGVASEVPKGPKGEGLELFCPRRWLVPGADSGDSVRLVQPANRHGGFMPFGHGVRICPGASLAKVEAITALVYVLQSFEVAPIKDHPPIRSVTRFTQTFDGEIQLTLKPRV